MAASGRSLQEFYDGPAPQLRIYASLWDRPDLYFANSLILNDDGNHGVFGRSAEDFSVRMMQFFDHYLKDAPPPRCMTQGIPAQRKVLTPHWISIEAETLRSNAVNTTTDFPPPCTKIGPVSGPASQVAARPY
jgi:hypothetical protein